MKFLKFISLLQKHRLSYAISRIFSIFIKSGLSYAVDEISFSSPKTRTIICNLWNFLHLQNVDYHMQFMKFLYLLQKRGLSYEVSGISLSSPKTWTIICKF